MTKRNSLTRRQFVQSTAMLASGGFLTSSLVQATAADAGGLVIAVAAPMTGDSAAMGQNAQRGADMAIAAINAAAGIAGKPVTYEILDDMGTPKEAASVAQRIVDAGKYAAVIGHVNSSCTLAAMPIYADAGLPVLCGSSSNPAVTESGWQNIVRMTIRDDYGAQEYSAFAINNLGKKKLGVFFANDDYGRGLRDEMAKAAKALDGSFAAEAGFTPNSDKEFSATISDFKSKGVDAFMLNCNYTEAGLFLGQAKGLGLSGIPTIGPDSLLYNEFITLSQGAAEGAYILAAYDPYAASPITQAFMGGFDKAYGALPSQVAVFTHDFFYLIKAALAGGATSKTLIAAAKSMSLQAAGGTYSWDAKGDVKNRTFAVVTVKDGKFASTGQSVNEKGLEKIRT